MRKLKNRRGTELISIWELFVLLIIGGGIVIGVWLFYTANVDVIDGEVSLLYEKLALCLNENGYLNENYLNGSFDIMKECELNPKVIVKEGDFYFETYLTDIDANELSFGKFKGGNEGHGKDCVVITDSEVNAKNFAKCYTGREIVRYKIKDEMLEGYIVIKTASNQRGGKIPVV